LRVMGAHRAEGEDVAGAREVGKRSAESVLASASIALIGPLSKSTVWNNDGTVQGSGFRVQGSGFRVQGDGLRVQGSG